MDKDRFVVAVQTERFADGSIMGYYFDIYDRKTEKTVLTDGLYTTLEFAMNTAVQMVANLAKKLESADRYPQQDFLVDLAHIRRELDFIFDFLYPPNDLRHSNSRDIAINRTRELICFVDNLINHIKDGEHND